MATCKICNGNYRKGSIAFVMADGGLKGARVCPKCARNGVLLVAARPKVVQKDGPKFRPPEDVLKTLKSQLHAIKQTAHAADDPDTRAYLDGKIEGLENAIGAFTARV